MTFIRKTLFLIVAPIVFVVALLAAADNSDEVALRFLDHESHAWPISWWMLIAFLLGVLVGALLNLAANLRLRMDVRRAGKVADDRGRELDRVRAGTGGLVDRPDAGRTDE